MEKSFLMKSCLKDVVRMRYFVKLISSDLFIVVNTVATFKEVVQSVPADVASADKVKKLLRSIEDILKEDKAEEEVDSKYFKIGIHKIFILGTIS
jgi:hypothetical protein